MHIKLKVVFGSLILTGEFDLDYTIIIIQTIIVLDPWVYHDLDLDPRSYLQGQGHNAHVAKIHVRIIILHAQVALG